MRYARARYNQNWREWAYRYYLADSARALNHIVSKIGGGNYLPDRLSDLLEETKTSFVKSGEATKNIKKKLGGG